MICNKDIFDLNDKHPTKLVSFLKDIESYYNSEHNRFDVGEAYLYFDDYTTTCQCKSIAKPQVFNNTYRCICNTCNKVCNRCILKLKVFDSNENKSVCETCSYLTSEYECSINSKVFSKKRPRCENDMKETEEETDD